MLDAFIIDELRRREKEQDQADADRRPRIELPLHSDYDHENGYEPDESDGNEADSSGVVIAL